MAAVSVTRLRHQGRCSTSSDGAAEVDAASATTDTGQPPSPAVACSAATRATTASTDPFSTAVTGGALADAAHVSVRHSGDGALAPGDHGDRVLDRHRHVEGRPDLLARLRVTH